MEGLNPKTLQYLEEVLLLIGGSWALSRNSKRPAFSGITYLEEDKLNEVGQFSQASLILTLKGSKRRAFRLVFGGV